MEPINRGHNGEQELSREMYSKWKQQHVRKQESGIKV